MVPKDGIQKQRMSAFELSWISYNIPKLSLKSLICNYFFIFNIYLAQLIDGIVTDDVSGEYRK